MNEENSTEYPNYLRISNHVNESFDSTFQAWFYGLGNIYLNRRFKHINIVTDRHLVSNHYWNCTEENREIFDMLIKTIGQPDYTFLLYASPEIRYQRIINRNANDSDLEKVYLNNNAYEKMKEFLDQKDFRYQIIDTSNIGVNQIADLMLEVICNQFPYIGGTMS